MAKLRNTPISLLLAVVVFAVGCSGSSGVSLSDPPAAPANTSPDPAPSQPAPGTDEEDPAPEPRVPTRLQLPNGPVGSADAYDALVDELSVHLYEGQNDVPWPDLRNPDPEAAYRSGQDFQTWMMENNPTPQLAEFYTFPGSPEREDDVLLFSDQSPLLRSPSVPAYSMRIERVVHPNDSGLPDFLIAQIPEGSAAIVYWDTSGASDLYNPETGEVIWSMSGWQDEGPWVAIMAPSDIGWRTWYDALIDAEDLPDLQLEAPQIPQV